MVLLVLAIGTGAYGLWRLPDTSVPEPKSSHIEVDFSPGHPARSPITVTVTLENNSPPVPVVMGIDLAGKDFAHAGWSLAAFVPSGVQQPSAGDMPLPGKVHPSGGGLSEVDFAPGPVSGGQYTAALNWNDLASGPLQVIGPNLGAEIPGVIVINELGGASSGVFKPGREPSLPTPRVTVNQQLYPGGDFTYLGGSQPDHLASGLWSWNPEIGTVNSPFSTYFDVEARSATLDEQSHAAELYGGIALGVAAAALIASIQEFVNSGRRREQEAAT